MLYDGKEDACTGCILSPSDPCVSRCSTRKRNNDCHGRWAKQAGKRETLLRNRFSRASFPLCIAVRHAYRKTFRNRAINQQKNSDVVSRGSGGRNLKSKKACIPSQSPVEFPGPSNGVRGWAAHNGGEPSRDNGEEGNRGR